MTLKEINEKYYFMKNVEFEHQEGWADILDEFCSCLNYLFNKEGSDYGFKILQVKEKFGVLIIYTRYEKEVSEEIIEITQALINNARDKSKEVCEKCGKYGEFRSDTGWIHVYCDECEDEYIENTKKRISKNS